MSATAAILDIDELDLLTPDTRTAASSSGATTPTLHDEPTSSVTRKLRIRLPKLENSPTVVGKMKSATGRKRTLMDFDGFEASNVQNVTKKPKTELKNASERKSDKKANTIIIHQKKLTIEAARRRWLYLHRALFTPLLPPTTATRFFASLLTELANSVDRGTYIPYRDLTTQPKLIRNGTLKAYQLKGLSFLAHMYDNGMNCILADEMGLGKTLQTLALFAYIKESAPPHTTTDPHLVICPLSVVDTWLRELTRFLPSHSLLRFHAPSHERTRLKHAIRSGELSFDVCVTTYEGFEAEEGWFRSRKWTVAVCDEGQRIKNWESQVARSVQGLGSLYRLVLTGTPVQNNLVELWGLLHFLYPTLFTPPTLAPFRDAFNLAQGTYALPFLRATEKLLNKIMLRRTKESVGGQICVPRKEEVTVFVPMGEGQRGWVMRLLGGMEVRDLEGIFGEGGELARSEGRGARPEGRVASPEGDEAKLSLNDRVEGNAKDGSENVEGGLQGDGRKHVDVQVKENKLAGEGGSQWKRLMNLLMQLRKVCNHPYLLPDVEPSPYTLGEHLVSSSSKMILVDKLLKSVLPRGERVLIFSQWTSMLDLLEDFMALRDIPYARLDGSTPRARRTLDIKLFQQEKSPYQVYLISTKAGGLGINLTKATHVIMFDSDWNPQNDLQAIARAHRIGQTEVVKVYRLICQGSVEDQMLDRIRRKLFLSLKVMSSNTTDPSSSSLNDDPSSQNDQNDNEQGTLKRHELMSILRKGSSAVSEGVNVGLTFKEFEKMGVEEILEASRRMEDVRAVKIRKEVVGEHVDGEDGEKDKEEEEKLAFDAEEEERRLLQGVAQVQSRLFEGRLVANQSKSDKHKKNEHIIDDEEKKRERKRRYVTVQGYDVLAGYLEEKVVKKEEGKGKKEKRKKAFEWEDWCMYCRDGGDLILCNSCPRVVHASCEGLSKAAVKKMLSFTCSHHRCGECGRKTADAGGMLFRCRTCPQAYCEDCLPPGDIHAVGDTLPEMLVLGYGEKAGAYWIQCDGCVERFETQPKYKKQWEGEFREAEEKLAAMRS